MPFYMFSHIIFHLYLRRSAVIAKKRLFILASSQFLHRILIFATFLNCFSVQRLNTNSKIFSDINSTFSHVLFSCVSFRSAGFFVVNFIKFLRLAIFCVSGCREKSRPHYFWVFAIIGIFLLKKRFIYVHFNEIIIILSHVYIWIFWYYLSI